MTILQENPTLKLLRIIGSPFLPKSQLSIPEESIELYNYAFKNRIALLYLKALEEKGKLDYLQPQYEELHNRYHKTLITIERVSKLFNSKGIPYVVIKTIRPFPATPNDVDILFLGPEHEYKEAVEIMIKAGYVKFGTAPMQVLLFDPRDGVRLQTNENGKISKKGGIYYLDLYKELAVQYFVYLDKKKVSQHLTTFDLFNNVKVTVFRREIELLLLMFHCVFPTQSYGLEMFYTILYHLSGVNAKDIHNFIDLARENHATLPVRVTLAITAALHRSAFNMVPEVISEMLTQLESETTESERLARNDFLMPHELTFSTFFRTFLAKLKEQKARRSLSVQLLHMMNPKFARIVVRKIVSQRERKERYQQW